MNGWKNPLFNFFIIILRDLEDHPRMLKRMELTAKLLKSKKIEVLIIDMPEGDILTRIFNTILLSDWISYYLALEYKIDPNKIEIVNKFKKLMATA